VHRYGDFSTASFYLIYHQVKSRDSETRDERQAVGTSALERATDKALAVSDEWP
jgi:hypothetical protein